MKRFILLLSVFAIMLVSCSGAATAEKQAFEQFSVALKTYNKQAMADLLTEFPDHTPYVYLDDIFNDQKYIELYRKLYTDITYAVKSTENDRITVEVIMPNVQKLYTDTAAYVMSLALTDPELVNKLDENEENGIILIQEMMLALAEQEGAVETMTEEFTLTFTEKEGKTVIVCDDQLRALITGNFFLSKNSTISD